MRYLWVLILISACSSNTKLVEAHEPQQDTATAKEIVKLARELVEHQAKAQPKSWDISIGESMTKENLIIPPSFLINSGRPPRLGYAGLWNCQKIKVGSKYCHHKPKKHMIAQYITEHANGIVIGQVVVYGAEDYLLVASCEESGEVSIRIDLPNYDDTGYSGGDIEFSFDNEPLVKYKVRFKYNFSMIIADAKSFFERLMNDVVSVETRKISSSDSIQFYVKNFPKAWKVACGWHAKYDARTGTE